jgi:hypothetical protein
VPAQTALATAGKKPRAAVVASAAPDLAASMMAQTLENELSPFTLGAAAVIILNSPNVKVCR